METTSIAAHHHPLLRLPSKKADRFLNKLHLGVRDLRVSDRPRRCFGRLTSRFSDSGHQQYYVSTRSGTKNQEKEQSCEIKSVKNKLKLMRRLSTDLSSFSLVANGNETGNNLMDEAKISDVVELLQAQLQQLRLEQKDLKRKMKEEKARNKTTVKQSKCKSDSSSSSSSESSDSECEEVIDMSSLRSNNFKQSNAPKVSELPTLAGPSSLIQQDKYEELVRDERESCCGSSNGCTDDPSNSIGDRTATTRIEICMGGKCKKSGAEDLLEEFQRKVGAEGAVLGCKCMGKCKNGPNLRVQAARTSQGSGTSLVDSMCIGVGLRDVDVILANIFAKDRNEKCLMAPS